MKDTLKGILSKALLNQSQVEYEKKLQSKLPLKAKVSPVKSALSALIIGIVLLLTTYLEDTGKISEQTGDVIEQVAPIVINSDMLN